MDWHCANPEPSENVPAGQGMHAVADEDGL